MFLERTKEVKGVHENRPPSKEGERVVVDEVVNDDELVKDANPISLKEKLAEDLEGDESTSNSSSEIFFVTSQDEGLNESTSNSSSEKEFVTSQDEGLNESTSNSSLEKEFVTS